MEWESHYLLSFLTDVKQDEMVWISNLEMSRFFVALYESHHHVDTGEVEMKFSFVQNIYLPMAPLAPWVHMCLSVPAKPLTELDISEPLVLERPL
jgi:hypothetical protein